MPDRIWPMDTLLRFDRGTLILEGCTGLPEDLTSYFRYDARINAYRASAHHYTAILSKLRGTLTDNRAARFDYLSLKSALSLDLYPHQQEALDAWIQAKGRGLVVLPTGAGKSLVGVLALIWAGRSGLVVVPTLDLMYQWYSLLKASFPDLEIGLIGGGYYEVCDLSVATYDSAAIYMDRLGNRFGILVLDEVHHLPSDFYRTIAEFSLAPHRLGLTATPERSDQRHFDLAELVGPLVYHRTPEQLTGDILAPFRIQRIYVELSASERQAYQQALTIRNEFLTKNSITLASLTGWQRFVMLSARSPEGRQAMRAHQQSRQLAQSSPAKLRALEVVLAEHPREKTLIFTEDNATVYEISKRFLIPAITHQTKVKERQATMQMFKSSQYNVLVTSKVLNEGVDVPDAAIGVILSGSGVNREFVQRLGRILRRVEGKQAVLYEIIARNTRDEAVAERRQQRPEMPQMSLFSLLDKEGT